MKKKKQYKAVYKAHIDLRNDTRELKPLRPGAIYYFENGKTVSYSDIVDEAERIINYDLKKELQKYSNLSIQDVQMQTVYEGSVEIIFTVVFSFLELVGGLLDLYDATHLARDIAERYIRKKLNDKFGDHFKVDTSDIVPREWHLHLLEENMYRIGREGNDEVPQHDAFFYYLLVMNILLMIIVGILVLGAVKTVYF